MHRMVPRLRILNFFIQSKLLTWKNLLQVSARQQPKRNSSFIEKLCIYHTKSKGWLYWATSVVPSSCILNLKGLLSHSIDNCIKISQNLSAILGCKTLLHNGISSANFRCCFLQMILTIWRAQGLMNVSLMVWAFSFLTLRKNKLMRSFHSWLLNWCKPMLG